ncbi:fumarylacetoacetate hydrolase family protein [Pseudaeromonas sharmana]|uniref:Fumarylacetoacetate hydrolase family protein n=1 Tax=Pseudaeromonas sharmana TaxID=328412 RepID=A0ABV8CKB7_9GAMM
MIETFYWFQGDTVPWHPGKAVCVGRNYAAHAAELGNAIPDTPLLFIKPDTAFRHLPGPIVIPGDAGAVHFEGELTLLIGQTLTRASREQAMAGVAGIALALDLTLRDLQSELKQRQYPWEKAKAFDGSCPVSPFVPLQRDDLLAPWCFQITVNDEIRQRGDSRQMIWPMVDLVAEISQHFTLRPGDLVLTGTPAGVGPLHAGDRLRLQLGHLPAWDVEVVTRS